MEVKDPETFSPSENYQDTTSPQGKVRPYSKILLIVMFLYQKERRPYVCVLVAQSCLTLCDPMDCSPQGSPLHGIRQSRILEWVAIPFSRGSSWPRRSYNMGKCKIRHLLASEVALYVIMSNTVNTTCWAQKYWKGPLVQKYKENNHPFFTYHPHAGKPAVYGVSKTQTRLNNPTREIQRQLSQDWVLWPAGGSTTSLSVALLMADSLTGGKFRV